MQLVHFEIASVALALALAIATSPRLLGRFSLRTHLFVTTRIAVLLGLGVWASQ